MKSIVESINESTINEECLPPLPKEIKAKVKPTLSKFFDIIRNWKLKVTNIDEIYERLLTSWNTASSTEGRFNSYSGEPTYIFNHKKAFSAEFKVKDSEENIIKYLEKVADDSFEDTITYNRTHIKTYVYKIDGFLFLLDPREPTDYSNGLSSILVEYRYLVS